MASVFTINRGVVNSNRPVATVNVRAGGVWVRKLNTGERSGLIGKGESYSPGNTPIQLESGEGARVELTYSDEAGS